MTKRNTKPSVIAFIGRSYHLAPEGRLPTWTDHEAYDDASWPFGWVVMYQSRKTHNMLPKRHERFSTRNEARDRAIAVDPDAAAHHTCQN